MTNTLNEQLKIYRKKKFPEDGIRSVAEKIGISFAYLNKLEKGLIPSLDLIEKIAIGYELSESEKVDLLIKADRLSEHPTTKEFITERNLEEDIKAFFRKKKNEK